MDNQDKEIKYIRVEDIIPNRFQPRIAFDEKELNTLADSIIKYGIIQPLVVRPISDKYEIIAGERRYKASLIAGLKQVPVIIKTADDNTSAEIALLENLQRKNLTPIEEAQSYKKLINRGFTQEEIGSKLGVSQSSIANKLRLLSLPEEVQNSLLHNEISERHARSLLTLSNENKQKELLNKIIKEKLTVKQTEEEIKNIQNNNDDMDFSNETKIEMEEIRKIMDGNLNSTYNEIKSANNDLEVIDFKVPDVIKIDEIDSKDSIMNVEYKDLEVTPFIGQHLQQKNIIEPKEEIKESKNTNLEDFIIKPEIEDINIEQMYNANTFDFEKASTSTIEEKFNSIDLQDITNKIKDYINTLGISKDIINISEIDLMNKFQITIDIKKN